MSMKADGSGEKTLTQDPADEWGPSMSPNGKKIVFVAQRDADGNNEIATINADGSNFRRAHRTRRPASTTSTPPTRRTARRSSSTAMWTATRTSG